MLCPTCGSYNPEGAKFCGKCGERLAVQQAYPQQPPQVPQAQQSPQSPQPAQAPRMQQSYQPPSPQGALAGGYAAQPMRAPAPAPMPQGGGAVVSQSGFSGSGTIIAGVIDVLLILLITFTPWIEIVIGFVGSFQIAIPSAVMQLLDKGSELYQMVLGMGVSSSSDMQSALLMLTIVLVVLWVAPSIMLAFDAFRAFLGKRPTAVGGVLVSVSAALVLVMLMVVVNRLNAEAGGYVDFGQVVHGTPWLWASLVGGVAGAVLNKVLTK